MATSIGSLSDDLLFTILFHLPIVSQFRSELVSRRWNRLMHTAVWPRHSRLAIDTTNRDKIVHKPKGRKFDERWTQLLGRCLPNLVDLQITTESGESVVLELERLGRCVGKIEEHALPLKHLTIMADGVSLARVTTGTAQRLVSGLKLLGRRLPHLVSLCLRGVSVTGPGATPFSGINDIDRPGLTGSCRLHNCLSGFTKLWALALDVEWESNAGRDALTVSSLPASLGYLELRLGGPDSRVLFDNWLQVVRRDTSESLISLRLLSHQKEYSTAEFSPSPSGIRDIAGLKSLRSLQLPVDGGDERCAQEFESLVAELGHQLVAVSLKDPAWSMICALARYVGPTLEHLSLSGGGTRLERESTDYTRATDFEEGTLNFPALRSWKLRSVGFWAVETCVLCMLFPRLERIDAGVPNGIFSNTIQRFIFTCEMKSLSMAAWPATEWGLRRLSRQFAEHHATVAELNEQQEMLGGADFICRPDFGNGSLDENMLKLRLPHIRLVRELPLDLALVDSLLGEGNYLARALDMW